MDYTCSNCGSTLRDKQEYCRDCGTHMNWPTEPALLSEQLAEEWKAPRYATYCNTPASQNYKTDILFAILGLLTFLGIFPLLLYLLMQLSIGSLPMTLVTEFFFLSFIFLLYASLLLYPFWIYPSLFTDRPVLKSNKAISYLTFLTGSMGAALGLVGLVFPFIWNGNLTKKYKGYSNIVFVVLIFIELFITIFASSLQ